MGINNTRHWPCHLAFMVDSNLQFYVHLSFRLSWNVTQAFPFRLILIICWAQNLNHRLIDDFFCFLFSSFFVYVFRSSFVSSDCSLEMHVNIICLFVCLLGTGDKWKLRESSCSESISSVFHSLGWAIISIFAQYTIFNKFISNQISCICKKDAYYAIECRLHVRWKLAHRHG